MEKTGSPWIPGSYDEKVNHLKISAVLFDSTARLKSGNERVSDSRKSSLNENMLRICTVVVT